jgi:hypothetical protein
MAAGGELGTWRSGIAVRAAPECVLETLTDVDACAAWSPVDFEVDKLESRRLRGGSTVAVSGKLAGRRVRFCVEVFRAGPERLVLRAAGPVELLVDYTVRPAPQGSRVDAAISVDRGPGLPGGVVARATCVLLAAGVLNRALARIACEAERRHRSSRKSVPAKRVVRARSPREGGLDEPRSPGRIRGHDEISRLQPAPRHS